MENDNNGSMVIGNSVGDRIGVNSGIIYPFNYRDRFQISNRKIVINADRLIWDSVNESIDTVIEMIEDVYHENRF